LKLLIDQNIARRVAQLLRAAGHDAVHVADRGRSAAEDPEILELARGEGRILVSEDTDFGALLAELGADAPSFVLIRGAEPLTPDQQAALLIANLPTVAEALEAGAIVVFARRRVRVRPLPIRRDE
jgi:predicted nuclease of predicted toxin-antitoxin system